MLPSPSWALPVLLLLFSSGPSVQRCYDYGKGWRFIFTLHTWQGRGIEKAGSKRRSLISSQGEKNASRRAEKTAFMKDTLKCGGLYSTASGPRWQSLIECVVDTSKVCQSLVPGPLAFDWSHMTYSDQWAWAEMMCVIPMPKHLIAPWSLSTVLFLWHICKGATSSRWGSSRPVRFHKPGMQSCH